MECCAGINVKLNDRGVAARDSMKAGRNLAGGVKRMWPLPVIDFNGAAKPAVVIVHSEIRLAVARADGFPAQRALGASSRADDKDRADG